MIHVGHIPIYDPSNMRVAGLVLNSHHSTQYVRQKEVVSVVPQAPCIEA